MTRLLRFVALHLLVKKHFADRHLTETKSDWQSYVLPFGSWLMVQSVSIYTVCVKKVLCLLVKKTFGRQTFDWNKVWLTKLCPVIWSFVDDQKSLYLYSLCQKSFMSFGQKSFGQQMSGGHYYREALGGFKSLLWNCKHQPSVCWPNGFWLLYEKPFQHKEYKKWYVNQLTVDKMTIHTFGNETLCQPNVCRQNCFWPKDTKLFWHKPYKVWLVRQLTDDKMTGHSCANQTLCQPNVCRQNCFWPKSSNFFDSNCIKCNLSTNWLMIKWRAHSCVD